jgi:hypothetical protein
VSIILPQRLIPPRALRRSQTLVEYESDETVRRVVHLYEDGTSKVVEGAALARRPPGSPKTWAEIGARLGDDADTEALP